MLSDNELLIALLAKSVAKHGNRPLDTRYLLNLVRMVQKERERLEDNEEEAHAAILSSLDHPA